MESASDTLRCEVYRFGISVSLIILGAIDPTSRFSRKTNEVYPVVLSSTQSQLYAPLQKTVSMIQKEVSRNTSSASIPLGLFGDFGQVRPKDGDLVLLVGFGAGMTAASAILEWNAQ